MFSYFRKRRELKARARIDSAISAHVAYVEQHRRRQADRLRARGPHQELHADPARHGDYDVEQSRLAVYQRVVRAYSDAEEKPPASLWLLVVAAMPPEEW